MNVPFCSLENQGVIYALVAVGIDWNFHFNCGIDYRSV